MGALRINASSESSPRCLLCRFVYDGSDSRVSSEIDKVATRENKIEIPRICYASLGIRSTSSVFRHAAHRPRKRLNFGCGLGRAQNASKTRIAQLTLRSWDVSDC